MKNNKEKKYKMLLYIYKYLKQNNKFISYFKKIIMILNYFYLFLNPNINKKNENFIIIFFVNSLQTFKHKLII